MVRTLSNAFTTGRIAQAYMLTGVRGVGKTTTARLIARALNYETDSVDRRADDRACRTRPALPGDHGIAPCRCDRDGRRLQHRHRRRARDHRGRALPAGQRALQGLHHRRSAHALEGRLQRSPEDAGGAAAACEIRLRHHRDPQGAGHRPVALPALRPAPHRHGRPDRAPDRHRGQGERFGRSGSRCADRPRRGRLGARRAVPARSGDRALRRRHRRRCGA